MQIDADKLIVSLENKIEEILVRMKVNNLEDLVRLLESTRARTLMDVVEAIKQQSGD